MSSNPKPIDIGRVVMMRDDNGTVKLRDVDQETAAGQETLHEFFIVACNVGVIATCPKR
jgi:hypothetical protein